MQHCKPDRKVDRLHEEELDRLREMSVHNDIAFAAGLHYCAQEGICPPPWLAKGASNLLIELLKREKSRKRGRAAGRVARYRQDLCDFERWDAVFQVRELRQRAKEDVETLAEMQASGEIVQNLREIQKWLLNGTFECASMAVRGGPAFGSADAVRTVSYTHLTLPTILRV